MSIEDLKGIWDSSMIQTKKKTFYSFELDRDIATYKMNSKVLVVTLLNDAFYTKEDSLDKYIVNFIKKSIIANALDCENDIEEFELFYSGKTLSRAAI